MKNHSPQKGFIFSILIIVLAIIITCGIFYFVTRNDNKNPAVYVGENQNDISTSTSNSATSSTLNTINDSLYKCGFKVISPSSNSKVDFPLEVKGVVDNRDSKISGCSWHMFEGQAGVAQLYFYNINKWNPIGEGVPIKVVDWMTSLTSFDIVLNLKNDGVGLSAGTPMKIVFTEENASGQGPVDTYELPIILNKMNPDKSINNSPSYQIPKPSPLPPNTPVACTMEAKQCPDGSYVGRTGPKCEFQSCPSVK